MRRIIALVGIALTIAFNLMLKANALDIFPVLILEESDSKNTIKHSSHKQKKEFTPPELPYCRIIRADGQGVVIDYYPEDYNKTHKAYTLRWAVDNIFRPTVGSIVLDYIYTAGYNVELGTSDKAFIQDCLIRASRKVMDNTGGGIDGYSPYELLLKEAKGNIFGDYILKFRPPY